MARRGRGGKGSAGMGALVAAGLGAAVGYMAGASNVQAAGFVLPPGHKPAMRVPKGGASCANCKFASIKEDGPHCGESHFIAWNGGSRLPVNDPTTYCSDWWEPSDAARVQILSEST